MSCRRAGSATSGRCRFACSSPSWAETRGAAFGWLALGVQLGTAASPLLNGWMAAWSLPGAYVLNGTLAWVGAVVLMLFSRDLVTRR